MSQPRKRHKGNGGCRTRSNVGIRDGGGEHDAREATTDETTACTGRAQTRPAFIAAALAPIHSPVGTHSQVPSLSLVP